MGRNRCLLQNLVRNSLGYDVIVNLNSDIAGTGIFSRQDKAVQLATEFRRVVQVVSMGLIVVGLFVRQLQTARQDLTVGNCFHNRLDKHRETFLHQPALVVGAIHID